MSNMSYCRFRNTLSDFGDCLDAIDERVSKDENDARIELAKKAVTFLESMGFVVEVDRVDPEDADDPGRHIEQYFEHMTDEGDDEDEGVDETEDAVHAADEKMGPGFGYPAALDEILKKD